MLQSKGHGPAQTSPPAPGNILKQHALTFCILINPHQIEKPITFSVFIFYRMMFADDCYVKPTLLMTRVFQTRKILFYI